ncbi:MAG TPA: hypothetical protein VK453_24550 [Micromonosporaceae bacterium]|nr:hypothetical protein [Micromonosporaceae bacterium]
MIKAQIIDVFGRPTMFIGLSRANCERLLAGKPITVNGGDIGMDGVIVNLFAGETEERMVTALEEAGLVPADVATKMRNGYQLFDQVPATRADRLVYENRPRPDHG